MVPHTLPNHGGQKTWIDIWTGKAAAQRLFTGIINNHSERCPVNRIPFPAMTEKEKGQKKPISKVFWEASLSEILVFLETRINRT